MGPDTLFLCWSTRLQASACVKKWQFMLIGPLRKCEQDVMRYAQAWNKCVLVVTDIYCRCKCAHARARQRDVAVVIP